ncbi:hypothetical protein ACFLZ1_02750 [Patescibacteria group bacterium]
MSLEPAPVETISFEEQTSEIDQSQQPIPEKDYKPPLNNKSLLNKIKSLFADKKKAIKIIGIILLYFGAGLAFYIGIKGKSSKATDGFLNPLSSSTPSPSAKPVKGLPEISIPPQPVFKPKEKAASPSPESESSSTPNPSSSPTEESSSPSPSPSPETSPNPSPSLEPSPNPSPEPSTEPSVEPSPLPQESP